MRTPARTIALLAVGALAVAVPAIATVVVIPDLEGLTRRVDVIAHASVTDQTVVEEGGRLWTRTTLQVTDGLKGAKAGELLTVHQLGGRLGARQMWISGAHHFQKGDELVFFGARWAKGGEHAVIPFGVGYGVFDVVGDSAGQRVVAERIGDVTAYRDNADGTRTPYQPVPRSWTSVDAFKEEIRALLAVQDTGVGVRAPQRLQPLQRVPLQRGGGQ